MNPCDFPTPSALCVRGPGQYIKSLDTTVVRLLPVYIYITSLPGPRKTFIFMWWLSRIHKNAQGSTGTDGGRGGGQKLFPITQNEALSFIPSPRSQPSDVIYWVRREPLFQLRWIKRPPKTYNDIFPTAKVFPNWFFPVASATTPYATIRHVRTTNGHIMHVYILYTVGARLTLSAWISWKPLSNPVKSHRPQSCCRIICPLASWKS